MVRILRKWYLTSDVPQGSLLGPRLFSIFTSDLPLSLDSKLEMFADSILTQIQELLHQLLTWSKFNSMFIHPVKSEVLLISKTPFIGPISLITIDDKPINCVSSSSCLGVKLDNKFNWSPHIKWLLQTSTPRFPSLNRWRTSTAPLWNLSTSKLFCHVWLTVYPCRDLPTFWLTSRTRTSVLPDWFTISAYLPQNMKYSAWQNGHLYIICIREDLLVLHTRLFIT